MDYVKHVAEPIRQVAPRWSLRGFKEDYGHLTADVVLLSGEIHLSRKPVGAHHLLFASATESCIFKGSSPLHNLPEPRKFLSSRVISNASH